MDGRCVGDAGAWGRGRGVPGGVTGMLGRGALAGGSATLPGRGAFAGGDTSPLLGVAGRRLVPLWPLGISRATFAA